MNRINLHVLGADFCFNKKLKKYNAIKHFTCNLEVQKCPLLKAAILILNCLKRTPTSQILEKFVDGLSNCTV